MFREIIGGLLLAIAAVQGAEKLGSPLRQAHSHNDYEHTRPLWDALEHGFCSVEADIFLVDGKLLVAHDARDVRPERTLERLYLEPLQNLSRENGGRVYRGGPSVTLLIDIKSDAQTTYTVLEALLQNFSSMLTRFHEGKVETNAVTVIISGNRPREHLLAQKTRWAAFDGRLADLGKGLPSGFMPLVSDNFSDRFPSVKTGQLSASDRQAFAAAVQRAHGEGRAIRFWATKDDRDTWAMLRDSGVDYINTDNLAGLSQFLRAK